MKIILTIDPGLNNHTGWAVMPKLKETLQPISSGIINLAGISKVRWQDQCYLYADKLRASILEKYFPDECYIEFPEFWIGSYRGLISSMKNDLFKLAFLCGCYYFISIKKNCEVFIIKPSQWKGQLSKIAIDFKLKKILRQEFSNHESDAVAMGLAMKGLL